MTEEQAVAFSKSGWWENKTAEQITALQLYEPRLCLPKFSTFHGAVEKSLGRPVFTHEFASHGLLKTEFEAKHPEAGVWKTEMNALKNRFCRELYDKQVAELSSEEYDISPDFQCDQTEGFPTSLCVNWEQEKAWLQLNESLLMDRDKMELEYYRSLCADFGVRNCADAEDFNAILRTLGEDAVCIAELPEGEGPAME